MTDIDILVPLKIDLQLSTTALDGYLLDLINEAKTAIKIEGVELDDVDYEHGMLIENYAASIYRERHGDQKQAMPRSLRWRLNNLLFHQKAGDGDGRNC